MYRIKIKSNFFTAQFWGLLSFSFRTRKKLFGSQHYQYHSIAKKIVPNLSNGGYHASVDKWAEKTKAFS